MDIAISRYAYRICSSRICNEHNQKCILLVCFSLFFNSNVIQTVCDSLSLKRAVDKPESVFNTVETLSTIF